MERTCIESATAQLTAVISDADGATEISDAVIAYLPRFYRIAVGRLGNKADAEDAVQNALLLAWKNIKQFKGRAHISTWITAILINSTRLAMRKTRRHRYVSLDDQDPSEGVPAKSEMIFRLPARSRRALSKMGTCGKGDPIVARLEPDAAQNL